MNRIFLVFAAATLLLAALLYVSRTPIHSELALQPDPPAMNSGRADAIPAPPRESESTVEPHAPAPTPVVARTELSPHPRPGPCRIDGLVLARTGTGDSPVDNADVALREVSIAGDAGPSSNDESPTHTVLARTKSGSGGKFVFEGLSGIAGPGIGAQYRLHVRLPSGAEREATVAFAAETSTLRVVVIFGSACIRGALHGIDGKPLGRLRIVLDFLADNPDLRSSDWRITDPDGKYRFEALPAGNYGITIGIAPLAGPGMRLLVRRYHVDLADCDELVLDLGGSPGYARVRGNLVASADESLGRTAWIRLSRSNRSEGGSDVWTFAELGFEVQGGYDFPVEPGSWEVEVSSNRDRWQLPEPLVIDGVEFTHDITLPSPPPK